MCSSDLKEWAEKLGINPSAAITCVKPSGTVSQLVGCSSGIHPSYSDYYIRTIRCDVRDPLTQLLKDQGVLWEPDVTKPADMVVFSFPQKAPKGSVTRNKINAIMQLEQYLMYKNDWTEHNPSITVYVKEEEWMRVGAWVYDHFEDVIGVTFLPYSDHVYAQAPYTECTKEMYEQLLDKTPKHISWDKLVEEEDNTTSSQELACTSGTCSI